MVRVRPSPPGRVQGTGIRQDFWIPAFAGMTVRGNDAADRIAGCEPDRRLRAGSPAAGRIAGCEVWRSVAVKAEGRPAM